MKLLTSLQHSSLLPGCKITIKHQLYCFGLRTKSSNMKKKKPVPSILAWSLYVRQALAWVCRKVPTFKKKTWTLHSLKTVKCPGCECACNQQTCRFNFILKLRQTHFDIMHKTEEDGFWWPGSFKGINVYSTPNALKCLSTSKSIKPNDAYLDVQRNEWSFTMKEMKTMSRH